MTTVTLLTKPGCHLCDDARPIVAQVVARHPDVALDERSILDDDALREEYAEDIPVVLVDGRVHSTWHVDAARLEQALADAAARAHKGAATGTHAGAGTDRAARA